MAADPDRIARTLLALQPYIERARTFSGWTLDADIRHLEPGPPWDYQALARDHAALASRVLDLGTGGGEVLSRIVEGVAARFVATEEWHVNAPVARRRLAPLGVDVLRADSLRPPFGDAAFDLILDRHEALDPAEVARVLRAGGAVITQQCGPDDWREFRRFFPRATQFEDHYRTYTEGFARAGLTVERRERHEYRVAFGSLGDVAFVLLVAPWTVPDFDPQADIEALLALEDALGGEQGLVLTESRYLIIARKPG